MWDGLSIVFVIQYIRCFKNFWGSANILLQIPLKMGKKWRRFLVQHILRSSKILCCFWIEAYKFFFFKWSYLQRCFDVSQCCENWRLKWQRCSIQRWNTQRCLNVVKRCKFQRWRTQRWFDVVLRCSVISPKNSVELTLKCSLGNNNNEFGEQTNRISNNCLWNCRY